MAAGVTDRSVAAQLPRYLRYDITILPTNNATTAEPARASLPSRKAILSTRPNQHTFPNNMVPGMKAASTFTSAKPTSWRSRGFPRLRHSIALDLSRQPGLVTRRATSRSLCQQKAIFSSRHDGSSFLDHHHHQHPNPTYSSTRDTHLHRTRALG